MQKKTDKVGPCPWGASIQCRHLVHYTQVRLVALPRQAKGSRSQCVLCDEIYDITGWHEDPHENLAFLLWEDTGHIMYYSFSALTPSIPGPARFFFGGKKIHREAGDEDLAGGVV